MRGPVLVAVGVLLAGCVPTADFVVLRDEVRQVQADNRKLKTAEADLRKRLDEQEQKRPGDQGLSLNAGELVRRLDQLEALIEGLKLRQQGFDQKLGELLRRTEEAARPQPEEGLSLQGQAPGRSPKAGVTPPPAGLAKPSKPGTLESRAAPAPTVLYSQAYSDYLKGNYDLAVAGFEDFLKKFPATSLAANAQYWIGESYYNKQEYRPAVEAYERVIADYPKSEKVAAALYKAGVAYAELGDVAKARSLLKRVLEEHPQSDEANRAKQKLADLR